MNFTIEKKEGKTYLAYQVQENEQVDNIALNMITRNDISGLLKFNMLEKYDETFFYIDITGRTRLDHLLEGKVKRNVILNVLESIAKTLVEADNYMLDSRFFLFGANLIYVDMTDYKAELVYLPIYREEKNLDCRFFVKTMLFNNIYDTSEDCNYVAHLINFINSKKMVDMKALIELIDNIRKRVIKVKPASSFEGEAVNDKRNAPQHEKKGVVKADPTPNAVQNNDSTPFSVQDNEPYQTPDAVQKPGSNNGFLGKLFKSNKEKPEKKSAAKEKNKQSAASVDFGMAIPGKQQEPASYNLGGKEMLIPGSANNTPQNVKQPDKGNQVKQQDASGTGNFQGMKVPGPKEKGENKEPNKGKNSFEDHFESHFESVDSDKMRHTIILDGSATSGKTVFRSQNSSNSGRTEKKAYITRVSTNEIMEMKTDIVKIGKEQGKVNFLVSGNSTISRLHAQIVKKDGKYYLVDLNSTNNTYLEKNKNPLIPEKYYPLSEESHFTLSDEEFVFEIK